MNSTTATRTQFDHPPASEHPSRRDADDPRIAAAVREYLAALEVGEKPDRGEFLARHSSIAGVLADCLDAIDFVHGAAADLSGASALGLGSTPQPETHRGTLGDFRLIREIGRGGMGVVYEAEQISLNRRVALKVLPFASVLDSKQLQRFKNEAQAAAQLHHTNIVPVHAVGSERGVHYYAMQFIEGQTLAEVIGGLRDTCREVASREALAPGSDAAKRSSRGLTSTGSPAIYTLSTAHSTNPKEFFRTVARLGIQVAEALDHAHQVGIVHRDIKPGNLMLDVRGNLWVTDFGLARIGTETNLTMTGDLVGTLRYMSPEQALAKRVVVDHRTDIYSLGVTLYELLTLQPAFASEDRHDLLRQIAFDEPRPPRRINDRIPPELETIVLKATAKNPTERYSSAQELAEDLERLLRDEPIKAKRPTLVQRARKWSRRHQPVIATAFAAGATLLLLGVAGLITSNRMLLKEQSRTLSAHRVASEQEQTAQHNVIVAMDALDRIYLRIAEDRLPRDSRADQENRIILEDVLSFYEKLATENSANPEVRYRVSRACGRVAEIRDRLGQPEVAMPTWQRATVILGQLVAENPTEPRFLHALADSYYGLLKALWSSGDQIAVAEQSRNCNEAYERLVETFGRRPQYMRGVLSYWNLQGGIFARKGEYEIAAQYHGKAIELANELLGTAPDDRGLRRTLAVAHCNLGVTLTKMAKLNEANEQYNTSIDLIETLAANELGTYGDELTLAYFNLGLSLRRQGDLDGAGEIYRKELETLTRLVDVFPAVPNIRNRMVETHNNLGFVCLRTGKVGEAIDCFRHAVGVAEALQVDHPNVTSYRRAFTHALNNIAWLMATSAEDQYRDPNQAVEYARRSVTLDENEGDHWSTLGTAYYYAGKPDAAIDAIGKAMPLRSGGDSYDFLILAMAHWRIGEKENARLWYDRGVEWIEKHQPEDQELRRFRAEAVELLEL